MRIRKTRTAKTKRRKFTAEFKQDAVQMLLDGHSAESVAERLGLARTNLLYRWKQQHLASAGPVASTLEARVRELEEQLRRTERERDILKKRWLFSADTSDGHLRGD